MTPTVVLLFGGESPEYSVSLRSAARVLSLLSPDRFSVLPFGITRDGRWYRYTGDAARIPTDEWHSDPRFLREVSFCRGGFVTEDGVIRPDAVLPVLHGGAGEDGRVAGLFDLLGIPYVGCRAPAASLAMHKHHAKALFAAAGIPVLPWRCVTARDADASLPERIFGALGVPVFVKPDAAGSSVGCAKAATPTELTAAVRAALAFGDEVLIEPFVRATECEVAICEAGGDLFVSRPGCVVYGRDFYDYDAKYALPDTRLCVPAPVPPHLCERMRTLALRAFRAIGGRQIARCDFFVTDAGDVRLSEINVLPGMTERSLWPTLLEDSGAVLPDLFARLIAEAGA